MNDQDFTIAQQIARLEGLVTKGFEGVHLRQDISNHRTDKNEKRLDKHQEEIDILATAVANMGGERKGSSDTIKTIITVGGLVVAILALLFR